MGVSFAPYTAGASYPMGSILPSTAPLHHARSKAMSTRSMGVYDIWNWLCQLVLVTCLLFFFHPYSSYHYQCFTSTLVNAIVFDTILIRPTTIQATRERRLWDPGIGTIEGSNARPSTSAVTTVAVAGAGDTAVRNPCIEYCSCLRQHPWYLSRELSPSASGTSILDDPWCTTRKHPLSTGTLLVNTVAFVPTNACNYCCRVVKSPHSVDTAKASLSFQALKSDPSPTDGNCQIRRRLQAPVIEFAIESTIFSSVNNHSRHLLPSSRVIDSNCCHNL